MDDEKLAWKQSLVYFFGLITTSIGIFTIIFNLLIGFLVNVFGLSLLMINIISLFNSTQKKEIKIALLIPKILFFIILLLGSLFMYGVTIYG
ncbi:MAG: hypothetical protein ACLFPJ_04745 [Candidatus Woesearchaeota archaeon]